MRTSYVLLLIFCVSLPVLSGCGYWYYYAYYVPPEALSEGSENQRGYREPALPDAANGAGVTMYFKRTRMPFVRGLPPGDQPHPPNRECFTTTIDVDFGSGDDSTVIAPTVEELASIVSIDEVWVSCASTRLNQRLTTEYELVNERTLRFSSASLCLPRKHKRIEVSFRLDILAADGSTESSQHYSTELVRWENRNWLGLE